MVKNLNILVLVTLLWVSSTSVWAYGNEYLGIGMGSAQYQFQDGNIPSDYPNVLDRNGFKPDSLSLNVVDEIAKGGWLTFAWLEVILAAYAPHSAKDPKRTGAIGLLIAPSVFQHEGGWGGKLFYTAFVGYNLSIDEDDYSESEVARNNFILLNLTLGIDRFLKGFDDNGKHSFIGVRPINDGMLFTKNYRFD